MPFPLSQISASDPRLAYAGRFDATDPAMPVIIWSGSRISLDFSGPRLELGFGPAVGQNFFNLTVDGVVEILGVPAGPGWCFVWPRPLGPGRHRLELFKRSEASHGHVVFAGIGIAARAEAWSPGPGHRLKMEFIGDSITAGACNEDGRTDQWDDMGTHNHALSYANLTAQGFRADHRAMAVSGMGIVIGWEPQLAGEVWDKVYPRAGSLCADLAAWRPDIVLVNLGENDASFTEANQRPFPPAFTADYVALVKEIRAAYPRARIVLLRGGMSGGATNQSLRTAWESAVRELEAVDPAISHYVFAHWSELHPRVSDHRAMAVELTSWLKGQSWMPPHL